MEDLGFDLFSYPISHNFQSRRLPFRVLISATLQKMLLMASEGFRRSFFISEIERHPEHPRGCAKSALHYCIRSRNMICSTSSWPCAKRHCYSAPLKSSQLHTPSVDHNPDITLLRRRNDEHNFKTMITSSSMISNVLFHNGYRACNEPTVVLQR